MMHSWIKSSGRRFGAVAGLAFLLLALPGCREHEQGRAIHLQKGAYAGRPGPVLSADQVAALRHRALYEME